LPAEREDPPLPQIPLELERSEREIVKPLDDTAFLIGRYEV